MDKHVHQSPLSYVGGKYRQMKQLLKEFPDDFEGDTYFEPFLGGGNVLLSVLQKYGMKKKHFIASDISKPLITFWNVVKNHPKELWQELKGDQYRLESSIEKQRPIYNALRDEYNRYLTSPFYLSNVEIAAIFLVINQTCYRGLQQFNKEGRFTTLVGPPRKHWFNENLLLRLSALLNQYNVSFHCCSYEDIVSVMRSGDLCYCDPPYYSTRKSLYIDQHTTSPMEFHSKLAHSLVSKANEGVNVIVSNSCHPHIRQWYNEFKCIVIVTKRALADKRCTKEQKECYFVSRTDDGQTNIFLY